MQWLLPFFVIGCVNIESGKGLDTGRVFGPTDSSGSTFVNDCTEGINDQPDMASGLSSDTQSIDLCDQDVDFYVVDVEPGTWMSLTMNIDGSGHNGTDATDLDLWEINSTETPIDPTLDRFDTDLDGYDVIWSSEAHSPLERLAWFNPSSTSQRKIVMVNGFDGAVGEYALSTTESRWTPSEGCSDDCDDLMLFPQASSTSDGYLVTQWTQYSHVRRSVAYHIQNSTRHVHEVYGHTAPLGLGDMSQYDAVMPGELEDAPRHAPGTHEHGNHIDVAYYQTGENNLGREVCENDGFFCSSEPVLLDAEPTALLVATILEEPSVSQVAVDPMIREAIVEAAAGLTATQQASLQAGLVAGDEWPQRYVFMHIEFNPRESHPIEG